MIVTADLNDLSIIEIESILNNLKYDIKALGMDIAHEHEYYALTPHDAFELLLIANDKH